MAEKVLASTMIAPKTFEVWEYPMPDIPSDAGLLRVEVTGVCGSDVHQQTRMRGTAHILGHEIVGWIAKLGSQAARKWPFKEGDRVALEEYMPCGACDVCRTEDYRFCPQTDPSFSQRPLFYGTTPVDVPPSLWGGYSHYVYLHPNCVMHRVPDLTGGKGVNLVVNVTGGGKTTVADSIAVAAKLRCTIVLAAAGQEEINVGTLGRAKIVLKRANGHSYFAVEQAIRLIASGKYPLHELCTHSYGQADVGLAIRTVAGDGMPGSIHVSVLPWSGQ
jgi:threonine dehydrogenase-like Zn-dependent dehydrogenase